MDFEQVYNEYLDYVLKRHKKQGFITIRQDFSNHILPYFRGRLINTLNKQDIIKWQNNILEFNYSNKYNSKLYSTFSSFIKYCVLNNYLEDNIVLLVGNFKKKIEIKTHVTYNIFEFRKFRYYLDDYILKQFFTFMFFYGTRPSETMALRFSDIKNKYVYVRHSLHRKGDRELDTPKNQSSVRILKISLLMQFRIYLLKRQYENKYGFSNDYYVFGGLKPLAPTTIDRHKKNACDMANLRYITQHEFRHSYATREIHKKRPIDVVSRSMGHSKVSTTVDIYLHQEKNTPNVFFN